MFDETDFNLYLEDLKTLTLIDSPTNHKEGIEKIINFFISKVEDIPLIVQRKTYNEESGDCLLITNAQEDEEIELLMVAHIDTVYPVGLAGERGFKIVGTKAYGAGVVDNKGGALLGLYALKKMDLSQVKVALLLNSNEEEGSKGNHTFIEEVARRSKYAFILEPTRENGHGIDKRFGVANYKIKITGKPAGVINFKEGSSALLEAAKFIKMFESFNLNSSNSIVNIVLLEGNEGKLKEVQHLVNLGLQVRFADNKFLENVVKKIELYQNSLNSTIKVEVIKGTYYPCLPNNFKQKDLKRLVNNACENLNVKIGWESSFGGSDGCFVALEGKCVVLDGMGPLGGNFHDIDHEYLDISSIQPKCNIIIHVTNQIIKSKELQKQKDIQLEYYRKKKEKALQQEKIDEK